MSKRNLFSIWFGEYRAFTIRYYSDVNWFCRYSYGVRSLGPKRFSMDVGPLGFIFENYR